jgi:hypothetical protein
MTVIATLIRLDQSQVRSAGMVVVPQAVATVRPAIRK